MPPVATEHGAQRELLDRALFLRLDERLGFDQAQPHPQADDDHDGREEERHPPAPFEERLRSLAGAVGVGEQEVDREEDAVGDDEAERRADLGERPVPGALSGRRVLGGHEGRARPLTAECEALREPQHEQHEGGPPADLLERGQASDEEGRDAHRQQRGDEGGLPAEPVAEVAEHDRADRARDHRRAEHRERREERGGVVAGREEQDREDEDGRGRVGVEVVELDRRADEARGDDARARVQRGGLGGGCSGGHDRLPGVSAR